MDLSNTTWAQKGSINKLRGNACGSHGPKTTIKNSYQQGITFGTRIGNRDDDFVTIDIGDQSYCHWVTDSISNDDNRCTDMKIVTEILLEIIKLEERYPLSN